MSTPSHITWNEAARAHPLPVSNRSKQTKPGRIYGRGDSTFDMAVIVSGLRGKTTLPNPAGSAGCSPALRELFAQAGATVAVVGEMYDDGQTIGHSSGDALDLTTPSDGTTASLDPALRVVTSMPSLFSVAAYYLPDTPQSSVFVWDGVVVDYDSLTTSQLAFLQKCADHLHVASSRRRLLNAMQTDTTVHTFVINTNTAAAVLVRDMFTGTTTATGIAAIEENPKAASA